MGLCLVAVFVASAVAVATASAITPQFVFATGTGSYKVFSSKGGEGKLETTKGETVTCKKETNVGEIEGTSPSSKVRDILISYTGCTSKILTKEYKCKSAGANEEEIKTFDLLGRLGWLKSPTEAGVLFDPEVNAEKNPKNLFAEFACTKGTETIEIKVKGSVIAKIGPVGTLINPGESFAVTFKKGTGAGVPGFPKFEGEAENKLETETTTSKAFVGSAAAGEVEIFPLVSTKIEA